MNIVCEERYNNRKETLGFYNIFKDRTYSAKVVKRGKKYSQVSMRSNTVKSSQERSHLCPVKSIPKSIAVLYSERQKQQGEEQRPSLKSFWTWKTQTFLTCRWNSSHYKRYKSLGITNWKKKSLQFISQRANISDV